MMKKLAFDLDDTLCHRPKDLEHLGPNKYFFCKPDNEMISIVNDLYDKGNIIIIYTARGMDYFNGDVQKVHEELYDITENSLKEWGVKYHQIVMGKIHFDMLIDDKAMGIDNLEKIKNL